MKKTSRKLAVLFLTLILAVGGTLMNAAADETLFSGGAGTETDPYIISTADDLVELSTLSNSKTNHATVSSAYFKLTADIDMTGKVYDGLGGNSPDNGWAGQFLGTIDGDGHVISNLEISNDEGKTNLTGASRDFAKGFIAFSSGATVKNLGLDTLTVTTAGRAGGVVAFISGDTTIENCFVRNAEINGNTNSGVGGIAGYAQANKNIVIRNCYTVSNVGIFGKNDSAATTTMEYAYSGADKGQFSQLPNVCKYVYRFTNASTPQSYWHDGAQVKEGITFENTLQNLGSGFETDKMEANGGYPVLAWENERTSDTGIVSIKNPSAEKTDKNIVSGSFEIKNYNTEEKSVNAAAIVYGDADEMLAAHIYDVSELDSGKSDTLYFDFGTKEGARYVNIFLWDSLTAFNETDYAKIQLAEN